MIDFGLLFSQLFSTLWLPPLLILAALFKSAWFKGFIGEVMVNLVARLFLYKNDYHLIKRESHPLGPALIAMARTRIYNAGHQHPPRLSLKRIFGGFFCA